MHIAALKPLYLDQDDVDAKFVEKEKEIFVAQLKEAGKPESVIERIIEGKVKKLYSEVCLLKQQYVKDDKLTVDQKLKEIIGKVGENIKISNFSRFDIGA